MKYRIAFLILFGCNRTQTNLSVDAEVVAVSPPVDAAPPAVTSWTASYTASAATLYVSDGGEWSGMKFRGEDAGSGLGTGTLHFVVDPKTGVVTGNAEGPIGALSINGSQEKDTITFSLRPNVLNDDSFFGTGEATVSGTEIKGRFRVSRSRANVIREATFSSSPKP